MPHFSRHVLPWVHFLVVGTAPLCRVFLGTMLPGISTQLVGCILDVEDGALPFGLHTLVP